MVFHNHHLTDYYARLSGVMNTIKYVPFPSLPEWVAKNFLGGGGKPWLQIEIRSEHFVGFFGVVNNILCYSATTSH